MRLWQSKNLKNERGSILLEAALCLPVLLLMSLGVAQFAQLWLCRTMVQYAAYCAARATVTAPDGNANELRWARNAAAVACAPIAFMNPSDGDDRNNLRLPGISWEHLENSGGIPGSGALKRSTNEVLDVSVKSVGSWQREVKVAMNVPLIIPLAGDIIGGTMQLYQNWRLSPRAGSKTKLENDIFPRLWLHETVYIVKPFKSSWSAD